MAIEILTSGMLQSAIALAEDVFRDPDDIPGPSLAACVMPHVHGNNCHDYRACWCWVNCGCVLGLISLCQHVEDYWEAIHLEWFCTSPLVRRQGIGTQLLEHALREVRQLGVPFLRLTTSTEPEEVSAQRLYEKYGIKVVREDPQPYKYTPWSRLYRELSINSM